MLRATVVKVRRTRRETAAVCNAQARQSAGDMSIGM